MWYPSFINRGYFYQKLGFLQSKKDIVRSVSIILLALSMMLSCIAAASCTSALSKNAYVAKLTYKATQNTINTSEYGVEALQVNLGYFSSCLQFTTIQSHSVSDFQCSTNETTIILSNSNYFNTSVETNVDLFNFFIGTGKSFRVRCLNAYVLIISVVFSFLTIMCYGFSNSSAMERSTTTYKYVCIFSYLSFILTLVNAIWLETNITTALQIMNRMADQNYSLSASRGITLRGLVWASFVFQIISSLFVVYLGILVEHIEQTKDDMQITEKEEMMMS